MVSFNKPPVFINYRRDDSRSEAGRLNNDLENAFGLGFVFQDIEDIDSGSKWIDNLIKAGEEARVILAVIGPGWLQKEEDGKSRLMNKEDWVRKELESALRQKKTIIPVLVNNGTLPEDTDLPPSLRPIRGHQSFDIRTERWNHDIKLLIRSLSKITGVEPLHIVRQKRRTKYLSLAGLIFLLVIGAYFITGMGKSNNNNNGLTGKAEAMGFCPDFDLLADLKTLIFPFAKVSGADLSLENNLHFEFSRLCEKNNIKASIENPNTTATKLFDIGDARQECPNCGADIFVTGTSYESAGSGYGFRAFLGFCDPVFRGFGLNEELLNISATSTSINELSNDPDVAKSLEYVIEVYLAFFLAKNEQHARSSRILNKVLEEYPGHDEISKTAYKILWQNQYKLGEKSRCANTLGRMYHLDNSNTKALAAKSVIEFEQKKYESAIEDLNILISKTSKKQSKDRYIEKRGDAYVATRQYQKARSDYEKIASSQTVNRKIIRVNDQITDNNSKINGLRASGTLSDLQKTQLADLQIQNGDVSGARTTLRDVDVSNISASQIRQLQINPYTLKLMKDVNPQAGRPIQKIRKSSNN